MGLRRFAGALAGLALGYVLAAITDPGLAWAQPTHARAAAALATSPPTLKVQNSAARLDGFTPNAPR